MAQGGQQSAVREKALSFLQEVHDVLPDSYEPLIDSLSEFRERRITVKQMQDMAIQLLRGEKRLATAFSQFLPATEQRNYEINVSKLPETGLAKRKRDVEYGDMRLTGQQQYQIQVKNSLPVRNLKQSWASVCAKVKTMVAEIQANPEGWIPVVQMSDILADKVSPELIQRMKTVGVIKIRQTVTPEEAGKWNTNLLGELKEYLAYDLSNRATYDAIYNNTEGVARAPEFGGVQHVFYSKSQFEARSHANMVAARSWLNRNLWKYRDGNDFVFVPDQEVTYVDRIRHRLPGYAKQFGMKEHIDNGSLSHWADDAWQRVYAKVWSGSLNEYDPWDARNRTEAAGQIFRSFQGWLALTAQGQGDGTLEVVPMVKEAMEYILLRPLQSDVPAPQFPGARDNGLGDSIEVTSRWHALLLQAKISIGHCNPGDTVWWHPDVIHAVEQEHLGTAPSNVMYIPAAPLCPTNARYIGRQRRCFERGQPPPDFTHACFLEKDSKLRARPADLTPEGKRMMGIEPFATKLGPAAERVVRECNQIVLNHV